MSACTPRDYLPQKRMRRGTRSCLECRRRKVRCIVVSDTQACEGCASRELECLDQERRIPKAQMAKNKKVQRQKQAEVENLIDQLLQKLVPDPDVSHSTKFEMGAIEALRKLKSEFISSEILVADVLPSQVSTNILIESIDDSLSTYRDHIDQVPLVSLLKNDALHVNSTTTEFDVLQNGREVQSQLTQRSSQTAGSLKRIIPNGRDLTLILEAGQRGWNLWQKAFPEIVETQMDIQVQSLQSYIVRLLDTEVAVVIAKILLCVALCIQQLPPEIDITQMHIPTSSEALEEKFLVPVDNLLSIDDQSSCTLNGLQCMLIQTRVYINAGKLHKAWLIFRRAVSIAHLLGLHRHSDKATDKVSHGRGGLWPQIWQGERYLSLILGLPYTASDRYFDWKTCKAEDYGHDSCEVLQLRLGAVAGSLIDRDQGPDRLSISATMQIEEELERCKKSMPEAWWEALPSPLMSLETISYLLAAKFTYYNIRKLLHLPYMLQSDLGHKYEFARVAVLEASREMIKVYQIMRDDDRPLFRVCNMADFQTFTAAMVLVLNLIGDSSEPSPQAQKQEENDWEIIRNITEVFKRASKNDRHSVATQAAQILEDIYKLRSSSPTGVNCVYQATVPYFGKFSIKMGKRCGDGMPLQKETGIHLDANKMPYDEITTVDAPILEYGECIAFERFSLLPEADLSIDWSSNAAFNLCDDWSTFLNADAFN